MEAQTTHCAQATRWRLCLYYRSTGRLSNTVSKQNYQESGRMLFLMENAHCATAGDTEQNGAKHFTVARRGIVTCFRHVVIVFAGIWRKTQNRNVLCEKFESLFCGYDFRARCCWSRAGPAKKMPLSWKMHRTHY